MGSSQSLQHNRFVLGNLPLVRSLANYRHTDFQHDLAAGLIGGIITVPQAIAYAFLAGLPPEAGLYACLVPTFLYALLGTSRELAVGPVAIVALMVASALAKHASSPDMYGAVTAVLCFEVGVLLLLLRAFQMGGIVNFLAHPVMAGFVNAAAIVIIVSQLAPFAGLPDAGTTNAWQQLVKAVQGIDAANAATIALGAAALVVLYAVRRVPSDVLRRIGPIVVIVASLATVVAFDLDRRLGIAVVGHVPAGLPTFALPPLDGTLWLALVPSSAAIALIAYIESYSLGTTLAARHGRSVGANAELVALGAANLGAAFTFAYPVAGSFSRSGVNFSAGARTQVASLVAMTLIVATLLWATPLFERLPQAVLAAIVIAAVADLIELRPLREYWSFYAADTVTHLITLVGVIAFGVELGLLLGVLFSVAFFVRQSSKPHIAILGRIGDTGVFRNVERHRTETLSHVAAVRVDENIYFANAHDIESRLIEIATQTAGLEHLLLVCSAVNFIDTSGLAMLERVNDDLERLGIQFHLSDVKGPVMDRLNTTRFPDQLTGSIFFSTDLAMRGFEEAT